MFIKQRECERRLLPDDLLPLRVKDGQAIIGYLGDADRAWLRTLIDEFERYAGRPERELRQRLGEPLPVPSPLLQRRAATAVLSRIWRSEVQAPLPPREIRRAVFDDMAAEGGSRSDVLNRVGRRLGLAAAVLAGGLFADLPGERIVVSPLAVPSPTDGIQRTNLALAQSMLFRATSVRVRAEGGMRPLVRLAKLRGLICAVSTPAGETAPLLEISGPYALFRRTLLYGRALAGIVPPLVASGRFSLRATCVVRGQALDFALATGDPVSAPEQGRPFDSKLEERFVRDFRKAAPDWDVIREPEPVRAGASLVFPDFLLRHRQDPTRRFLIEIVGFWTQEYLEKKFAALRKAKIDNLIVCVDAERKCSEGELPIGARVVRFKRKIDPAAVLALANHAGSHGSLSRPTQ